MLSKKTIVLLMGMALSSTGAMADDKKEVGNSVEAEVVVDNRTEPELKAAIESSKAVLLDMMAGKIPYDAAKMRAEFVIIRTAGFKLGRNITDKDVSAVKAALPGVVLQAGVAAKDKVLQIQADRAANKEATGDVVDNRTDAELKAAIDNSKGILLEMMAGSIPYDAAKMREQFLIIRTAGFKLGRNITDKDMAVVKENLPEIAMMFGNFAQAKITEFQSAQAEREKEAVISK